MLGAARLALVEDECCGRGSTSDATGLSRRQQRYRLAEIYAEDAQWLNADPDGPHRRNRDDIFTMFRQRRSAGIKDPVRRADPGRPQRSSTAALSANRSLSLMTVAPELTGRGALSPQVAWRSNSRKKS